MKKFLGFILFLIGFTANAQSDSVSSVIKTDSTRSKISNINDTSFTFEKPLYEFASVEFNPGFSLPSGNFASGDYTNPLAGYAKEGYSIGANFSIKVNKMLNIMFCYSRQMNVFDEKSFAVNALKGVSNYTIQTDANWKNHFILGGVSGNIPLDDENYLTPRLLMGVCLSKTPQYEMFPASAGTRTVAPQIVSSQAQVQFAMRVGIGLKKNLTKQLFMSINPDFYYTNLKLNINKSFPQSSALHQSVSIISVSLSLGFRMYN